LEKVTVSPAGRGRRPTGRWIAWPGEAEPTAAVRAFLIIVLATPDEDPCAPSACPDDRRLARNRSTTASSGLRSGAVRSAKPIPPWPCSVSDEIGEEGA